MMNWKGSEKQIEYAQRVIEKFSIEIEALLARVEQMRESGAELADGIDFDAEIAKYRVGLARLQRVRSARWILDKARVRGAEWTVKYLSNPENKLMI